MFIFVLQLRETLHGGRLYVFTVYVVAVWALWMIKAHLSRGYRPWTAEHHASAAVVIPVVDEPLDLFCDVLRRIVAQRPDEILVVINGPRNRMLERVCARFPEVRATWTPTPGKRNALKIGVEATSGEVVVLVDSDTIWTDGTLPELLKPFADDRVGGVTTRQRIIDPDRNLLTRWADWLENIRVLYSMPAMSVLGQVGCLPGRTIAFRRVVLEQAMPAFMTETFLGEYLEISDDRTLTNECLKQGYRAVYQSTSLVYTDAPTHMSKLAKQQLRWSRGSQYNTLRMLPWMVRHTPVLAGFYLADIVLPFMLLAVLSGWVYRWVTGEGANPYSGLLDGYGGLRAIVLILCWTTVASVVASYLRQARHFEERPGDLYLMPVFLVVNSFLLMPIRIYGFFRMARADGWGTRAHAYNGERVSTTWNPKAWIPYVLGSTFVFAGVLYHG